MISSLTNQSVFLTHAKTTPGQGPPHDDSGTQAASIFRFTIQGTETGPNLEGGLENVGSRQNGDGHRSLWSLAFGGVSVGDY